MTSLKNQHSRYHRQIILPGVGEAGQEKIAKASVLVVGAGGLGCPALQYLAAAGVGRLGIADFDHVSLSNLPRQVLYEDADVGAFKTQAAAARLREMNRSLVIEPHQLVFNDKTHAIIARYDLILDCTDHFPVRYQINDACYHYGRPWIFGAASGWQGQVALFHPHMDAHQPCLCCFRPQATTDPEENCEALGVLGAVTGLVGTWQALLALRYILGMETAPQLWRLNAYSPEWKSSRLMVDPACPLTSGLTSGCVSVE